MATFADDPDVQAWNDEQVRKLAAIPDLLAQGAANVPGKVVGGLRGLTGLASGENNDQATAGEQYTESAITNALSKPFQTQDSAALAQDVHSIGDTTPGKSVKRTISDAEDLSNRYLGPGTTTALSTGLQALPYLTGVGEAGKGVQSLLERYPIAAAAEPTAFQRAMASQRGSLLPVKTTHNIAKDAVQAADKMQEAGATPEQIWGATGRQYGAPLVYDPHSGGWRAEISDKDFRLNPQFEKARDFQTFKAENGRWPTVEEAFSHPLLERIPSLWGPISKMEVRGIGGSRTVGKFQPPYDIGGEFPMSQPGYIGIHSALRDAPNLVHSTDLGGSGMEGYQRVPALQEVGAHELQHAVDFHGDSPSHGSNTSRTQTTDEYLHDVGETTARANEARLNMSTAERVARPYTQDMDYPWSETTIPQKPSARPVTSILDNYSIKPTTDRWGTPGYAVHNGDKPVSQIFKSSQDAQDELWRISEELLTPTPHHP